MKTIYQTRYRKQKNIAEIIIDMAVENKQLLFK